MGQLHAGVGRVQLTPALGAWLVGFAGRASGCTSIHDDLYATALVLDDGDEPIAIMSCDLIGVHPGIVRTVREQVRATTGLAANNVMLCCTHTHSGPPGYATPHSHQIDRLYAAYLPYQLASAVRLAWDKRQPAHIGHGSGAATIGINRRQVVEGRTIIGENPEGPVDREVGVLRVDDEAGTPLATLVNYACHPVIMGPQSLAVSADFAGRTREIVETATGAPMLFVQGACGDVNPLGGVQVDYTNCHKLGTVLAGEVVRVWGGIDARQTSLVLAADRRELELPLRSFPDEDGKLPRSWEVQERLDKEFPWSAEMGTSGVRMELQAFALGDLAIASVASEPFVRTGLAVKTDSPFKRTFFAGYTNGCVGYVPTAWAYPLGGYEVVGAHVGYRLPAPIAPEAEQMVVRACLDALQWVQGRMYVRW